MTMVVAIDVGGTSVKAALVDENYAIVSTSSALTPKDDDTGAATVDAIFAIVSEFEKSGEVRSIGFDTTGTIDEVRGVARWAGNLGWKELGIRELVQARTRYPVVYGRDVRCGALAELRFGAANGFAHSIFIPIGTGIAAALIVDGAIRAVDGFAGEIGHLNVGAPVVCLCELTGHLLVDPIQRALDERLTFQRRPVLKVARYGSSAGIIGCASMAFDALNSGK